MINKNMKVKTKELRMVTYGIPKWSEVSEGINKFLSDKIMPKDIRVEYHGSCGTADPMHFGTFITIKYIKI